MKIRWERIVAVLLFGSFIYLAIKLQPLLEDIFRVVNEPFGYDSPIKGIMLGILCLTLLAALKLILRK